MKSFKPNILISRPYSKLEQALNILPSNRFNVYACPTIEIHAIEKEKRHLDIFSRINQFNYLIFTSQYSVIETFEYLKEIKVDLKQLNSLTICAVGPMVSEQLRKCGVAVNMIPQKYTAQSLSKLFPTARVGREKILFPKGNRSAGLLEAALSRKGYIVNSPIVYLTKLKNELEVSVENLIFAREVHCIAFTSPSSVIALTAILEKKDSTHLLQGITISAIGPSTYLACNNLGLKVAILPNQYTVHGMARAISKYF